MLRFLLPPHLRPYFDRMMIGALLGMIVFSIAAAAAFGWLLGDNVGYAVFPAAMCGLVAGPVIAFRTRRTR